MQIQTVLTFLAAIGTSLPAAIAASIPLGSRALSGGSSSPHLESTSPTTVFKRNGDSICYDVSLALLDAAYDAPADAADCSAISSTYTKYHEASFMVPGNLEYGYKLARYNSCAVMVWAAIDYYTLNTPDLASFINTAVGSLSTADGLLGVEGHMTCTNLLYDLVPQAVTIKLVRWYGPDTNVYEG